MGGNRSEIVPSAKVTPVSCNHPLRLRGEQELFFRFAY